MKSNAAAVIVAVLIFYALFGLASVLAKLI